MTDAPSPIPAVPDAVRQLRHRAAKLLSNVGSLQDEIENLAKALDAEGVTTARSDDDWGPWQ
jgi:beta-phosphoglucomutase-like phosphatase (HAD superfamily)